MYEWQVLVKDINELKSQGVIVEKIGRSVLGRDIVAVHKGDMQGEQILLQAAVHGREWLTSRLAVDLLKEYDGDMGVWCVPMSNPDGCMLAMKGLDSVADRHIRELLVRLNPNGKFDMWKANARGVDINVNFNANWGSGVHNVFEPAGENYVGLFPESEVETQALVKLTKRVMPLLTVSLHAKGEVVYHGWQGFCPYESKAQKIADFLGYELRESRGSVGGYKDWFVATTHKLGVTIEIGKDEWDIRRLDEHYEEILGQNKGLLKLLEDIAWDIQNKKNT